MNLPDRFRLLAPVATGGMSEVHLANEQLAPGLRRPVVIKMLLPRYRDDEERRTMFFDEGRILARLSHPHVVKLFAAGQTDELAFLVLEYVPGPSLRSVLDELAVRGTRMPAPIALRIGLDLAEALAYVHDARDQGGRALAIVHRDLKPENVVIGFGTGPKLIDFGIARGEDRLYETATGVLKGTDGYMAPEQMRSGAAVDRRADIYAFGVLVYEMLAGRHPYARPSSIPVPGGAIEPLSTMRKREIRPGVDTLLIACLAENPDARPSTMIEVAAALRDAAGPLALWSEISAVLPKHPSG